ncbi:hypothetical protein BXZ70DRAFT_911565 [Cristinia sonorae]|uniref:DUF6589 domain-containing protein n=1 Tax=Cristinia sonorae TaxID=1940300 RepID=A0A8K0UCK4_9AGAR|nr:hypothetical protein BXZ70DRAFT_911565 [Cristinia sonorae]
MSRQVSPGLVRIASGAKGWSGRESFIRRLVPIGGDGLTFQKLIEVRQHLQFQSTSGANLFSTFEICWPFLELFHTGWMFLSRTTETHWGSSLTKDPSRLSHSSAKINRKPPTNFKKVDYYPGADTLAVTLQARLLDCWRIEFNVVDLLAHFSELEKSKNLPPFDQLRKCAESLNLRYSSRSAYYNVLAGIRGDVWVAPPAQASSLGQQGASPANSLSPSNKPSTATRAKKEKDTLVLPVIPATEPYRGDQCLAWSILFMHEAILFQEFIQAVAEGDPGRVYEIFKVMIFSFAGSTHTKYAGYTFEQVCILEFESSPELKNGFLRNWIINPSGKAGKYQAQDLRQEKNNLTLKEEAQRKNINIEHLNELKNSRQSGEKAWDWPDEERTIQSPTPELRILLETYRFFAIGNSRLEKGKLKKWISDTKIQRKPPTQYSRNIRCTDSSGSRGGTSNQDLSSGGVLLNAEDEDKNEGGGSENEESESDGEGDLDSDQALTQTLGRVEIVDGRLVAMYEEIDAAEVEEQREEELVESDTCYESDT